MDKLAVIDQVILALEKEIEMGSKASREAFAAATDEDAYSDGKYDTRSLEASYLAGGQAKIVKELGEALQGFKRMRASHFIEPPTKNVGMGSLVETRTDNSPALWYIIGPGGGGLEVETADRRVTVLTPHSPLGQKLRGKTPGDVVEMPGGKQTVISVR